MPAEWGFTEENRTQPVRGAALPMGFNRTPHYTAGLLLAGDAGGMVNPFNGEGIALRDGVRRDRRPGHHPGAGPADRRRARETVLRAYPQVAEGRLRWLLHARATSSSTLIGNPRSCRFATRHGVQAPDVMRFTMKLLGNLTETRGGDAVDRVLNALSKMTPAA